MSDSLISRQELKSILAPSENFKRLTEAEKLYVIYSKLQSLEELYLEEKDSFSKEEYFISTKQVVMLDNMMDESNSEHYIEAYFSLLDFLEDGGNNHDDKIYLQELDEVYLELKKLILLIEQNIDFEVTFLHLVEDFSIDSMIQLSFTDETKVFNDELKSIILNGDSLSISWKNQEYEFHDIETVNKIKEVILDYRSELYDFSKRQENELDGFVVENYLKNSPLDECVGAIDGIMFAVSNQFEHSELNDFYSDFKISLYHVVGEIISLTTQEESLEEPLIEEAKEVEDSTPIPLEEKESSVFQEEEPYDDKKQKKIIAEMLDISLEDAYQNSQTFQEMDAIYYWNPEGSSVVIDNNLDYLLTNSHVENVDNLLAAYRELRKESPLENSIPMETIMDTDTNIGDLTQNMIEEINQDYQNDRSIDNVFDFSDSLITENDLDVFWKRVSVDTLGFIIVKELEENNYFNLEILKQNINTFSKFTNICVNTELQSRNKQILNIATMTKQAPEKTLRSIYEIICKSLQITEVEEEQVNEPQVNEPVVSNEELMEYQILSGLYYNFVLSLPAKYEDVIKNSESSFKIGEVNVMLAKCSSLDKLEERASQWLQNSANTNSQTMLPELDRDYYVGDRNIKVLEKQLEKNNKRRVYKFVFFNNAMIIFAYSSQNEELSDIIDYAIEHIQIIELEEEQPEVVVAEENTRKLVVEHTPFHGTYGRVEEFQKPEAITEEYFINEDLEIDFKDFKVKILEITPLYVKLRIYDNHGVLLGNNTMDFKIDYQVGDCIGNVKYNQVVHLYKDVLDAGEYWDLRFE